RASRVVSSVWNVEDRAIPRLMARCYEATLTRRLSPASAHRRAQLSLLAEPRWADPPCWAAFGVYREGKCPRSLRSRWGRSPASAVRPRLRRGGSPPPSGVAEGPADRPQAHPPDPPDARHPPGLPDPRGWPSVRSPTAGEARCP